jgi:hypothetical protein
MSIFEAVCRLAMLASFKEKEYGHSLPCVNLNLEQTKFQANGLRWEKIGLLPLASTNTII